MLLIEAAISEARENNTTIFSELSRDFAFQSEGSRHPSSSQTEDTQIDSNLLFHFYHFPI